MMIDRDAYADVIDNRDKFAQQGLERCPRERARQVLLHDGLAFPGPGVRMDREGRAAGGEDRGAGLAALVGHVQHRHPMLARPREGHGDALRRRRPSRQDHLAERREVLLLRVDHHEGAAHARGHHRPPATGTSCDVTRLRSLIVMLSSAATSSKALLTTKAAP